MIVFFHFTYSRSHMKTRNATTYKHTVWRIRAGRSFKVRRVLQIWHSANFGSLPSATSPALGEVPLPSRSIRSVRPFGRPVSFFLPSAAWHTAKICQVLEKRHSALPSSPVEEKPCALHRVLHSAISLPSVFLPLPSVSGTRQSRRVR